LQAISSAPVLNIHCPFYIFTHIWCTSKSVADYRRIILFLNPRICWCTMGYCARGCGR